MPFTYNNLKNGFRWKRAEILNAALHSKASHSGQGASSLFCNALFCVLEQEFRVNTSKKKAILIWELFFAGHTKNDCEHQKLMVPSQAMWTSLLEMNIEGSGGVSDKEFAKVVNGMKSIYGVYDSGQKLTDKQRKKTTQVRKFKIIGGQASPQMFQPIVNNVKDTIGMIGKFGTTSLISAFMAKSIFKHRDALVACVRKAGFNADASGLTRISA